MKTSAKGAIKLVPDPDFEGERGQCVSFTVNWRDNYHQLKVRKPSEDIFTNCFIFYNWHKYRPPSTPASSFFITESRTETVQQQSQEVVNNNNTSNKEQSASEEESLCDMI